MTLGCATHSYTITDRDGGNVNSSGILTAVTWNRVLNEVSSASVIIGVSGLDCCTELGSLRSWRHQLNIYRVSELGASALVWAGPIVDVNWNQDQVSVSAVDVASCVAELGPERTLPPAIETGALPLTAF